MNARQVLWLLLVATSSVYPATAQEEQQSERPSNQRRAAARQTNYPPRLPGARSEVYKQIGDVALKLYIYEPANHQPQDRRPAIVFFFGGGWRSGSPAQFAEHCQYFASRGMVAMTADYRVASRHQVKAVECVKDAKSAIRWVRTNAERLGIDPDRIAAGGGSAGGHIAACAACIRDIEPGGENSDISSVPNALVLFNPAMSLVGATEDIRERTGVDPEQISPAQNVHDKLPPTIIFFGTDDRLLAGAQRYHEQARELGTRCELQTWEGKQHGFFNFGRDDNQPFLETTTAADRFLVSLGYLAGEPTVEAFLKSK